MLKAVQMGKWDNETFEKESVKSAIPKEKGSHFVYLCTLANYFQWIEDLEEENVVSYTEK